MRKTYKIVLCVFVLAIFVILNFLFSFRNARLGKSDDILFSKIFQKKENNNKDNKMQNYSENSVYEFIVNGSKTEFGEINLVDTIDKNLQYNKIQPRN